MSAPSKPEEHIAQLDSTVKEEVRKASKTKDDSLLTYVYSQVGSLIQGSNVFKQEQIDLLKKTATDVATQLNTAAQLAISSVDQSKLKMAADTVLGTTTTVKESATQAASNVKTATTTLTSGAQASATRAAEIAKPHVSATVATVQSTVQSTVQGALATAQSATTAAVAALPETAQMHIETARQAAVTQANALAAQASTVAQQYGYSGQAKDMQKDAKKLSADLTVIATDATVKAVGRLEGWIKDQHAAGKTVNATSVQRVVAALASTEAAKSIQQQWEVIKASNKHTTPDGVAQDLQTVQQEVAAHAASSAVTVVNTATAGGAAPAAATASADIKTA
ncbi:hypothetical protein M427DRAFT_152367 [Gonapodya prolifera JEL478]|uniref:Uncharacterized protein n=1 Tax=Gonapodya prolifera (strain JEL478) TaxID=1344416 RepID=A0A139ATA1_GONPJ|nr:hypothetical protein M427DRAFT_152367 [Gonapodya prolifera JEL478]|eukprot:KXS19946.1 hypothetical protein M427DRAFT_152367 [Gonapodya prolifera JEL478]